MLILGSVQLLVLGIFGEYLGRMFIELKGRPLFVIESMIGGARPDACRRRLAAGRGRGGERRLLIARALAARPEIALQLLRFLLVGIANTTVGLGTICLAKYGLGLADLSANLTGYLLGLCLSFALNRRWTFRDAGPVRPAALRFLAAFAAAYLLNLGAFLVATRHLGIVPDLGHLLGMVVYTGAFFVLSRLVVFTSSARRMSPR